MKSYKTNVNSQQETSLIQISGIQGKIMQIDNYEIESIGRSLGNYIDNNNKETDIQNKIQKHQEIYSIKISDFEIVKEIKQNQFYSLFLVKKTNNTYIAKVIKSNIDICQSDKSLVISLNKLMSIQHPTIITYLGYSLSNMSKQCGITIFMNYLQKGSLKKVLNDERKALQHDEKYTNTERQIILIGVSYAMMRLHQNHIINLNLKPENILIDDNYRPHISDFGLYRFFNKKYLKQYSFVDDNVIYTAPEILSNNKFNGKADVYSFGIIMYEILTNSVPYPEFQELNEMTSDQFVDNVVHKKYRPKFPIQTSQSFQDLISQCLIENANERPTFEELFNILSFGVSNSVSNCTLDDVNIEIIRDYVEDILYNNNYINSNDATSLISKENDLHKNLYIMGNIKNDVSNTINLQQEIMSIENFNVIPLYAQQIIVSQTISLYNDTRQIPYLINLDNILRYLLQFKTYTKKHYISIPLKSNSRYMSNINKALLDFNHFYLKSYHRFTLQLN